MARGRPVSIVFYAINGRGLGHLTRLLAIARAARELLEALDIAFDLEFVTTSEASFIADDFPVYKLPSKTAVANAGASRDRYVQRAKLIVSNLVAAQAPDLLVLDTVPYGAFQEFAFLRSYARASAYIYRHQDARSASSDLVQRHLELFDRIIVPDHEAASEDYPASASALRRMVFSGPITAFDPSKAWSRERVRSYFDVGPEQRLIYLAAGGGGDGREHLERLVQVVASEPRNTVLVGFGPLHRGPCVYRQNVIPLLEASVSRYFPGLDAAVSAAGFNSYEELLAARVPTLFFAQDKGLDRQDLRIEGGLSRGLHGVLPADADELLVHGRLADLLEGELGERVRTTLAEHSAPRGALRAAVELLATCAAMEGSGLDRTALYELAAWRLQTSSSDVPFAELARAYRTFRANAGRATDIAGERDRAMADWFSDAGGEEQQSAAHLGIALTEARAALGDDVFRWIASVFAQGPEASHRDKLAIMLAVLRTVGPKRSAEIAHVLPRNQLRAALIAAADEQEPSED